MVVLPGVRLMGTATTTRTCRWCQRPIASKDPRRLTCGHPVCKRKQSAHKDSKRDHSTEARYGRRVPLTRAQLQAIQESPDTAGRERITEQMEAHRAAGMDWTTAVLTTAHRTGETVATVMQSYKSGGGAPWNR